MTQNGKNGAHIDVHINIRRSIKRIKNQNILSTPEHGRHRYKLRVLFGSHGAKNARPFHPVQQNLIGKAIQLLNLFPLYIDGAGATKNVKQPRLCHAA